MTPQPMTVTDRLQCKCGSEQWRVNLSADRLAVHLVECVACDQGYVTDWEAGAVLESRQADPSPEPDPQTEAPPGYVWISRFGGYSHLSPAKESTGAALCGCPEPGMLRSFKLPDNSAGPCPCCLVQLDRQEGKQT